MVFNRYIRHANRYLGVAERALKSGDMGSARTFQKLAAEQRVCAERYFNTYAEKTQARIIQRLVDTMRRETAVLQQITELAQLAHAGAVHGHTWAQA